MPSGEFASKALFKAEAGWFLTDKFFFSLEEAKDEAVNNLDLTLFGVKWPVETYDNSLVYVPDPSEMK